MSWDDGKPWWGEVFFNRKIVMHTLRDPQVPVALPSENRRTTQEQQVGKCVKTKSGRWEARCIHHLLGVFDRLSDAKLVVEQRWRERRKEIQLALVAKDAARRLIGDSLDA